jgi:phosphatidylinositol 4-kinase
VPKLRYVGNLAFEKAPFKLPLEMVEVMGGVESNFFVYFRSLVRAGFVALRKGCKKILALTQLMIHAGS